MQDDLTQQSQQIALDSGADRVGVVKVSDLPEHVESIASILPGADSVMVVVAKHGRAALNSTVIQMGQFDTIHTYNEADRAAHRVVRYLESAGYLSVAVPAFIPIDMQAPKKGMRGEICWRRAAVRAGLGSYGENGLLVTQAFGSAIRMSGLVTVADLRADAPLRKDICDHCMRCIEACPVGALSGAGKINKKRCGDEIFKFGFRSFARLIQDLGERPAPGTNARAGGFELREIWQTFMTGNYYYCFKCQSQCPVSGTLTGSR